MSRRICIYQLGRLGDLILASSAIRLLVDAFGAEQCTLIVSDVAAPFAALEFPQVPRHVLPAIAPGIIRDVWSVARRTRAAAALHHHDIRACLHHQRDLFHEVSLRWFPATREVRLERATYPQAPSNGLSNELDAHRIVVSQVLGREIAPVEILPHFTHVQPAEGDALIVCPLSNEAVRNVPPRLVGAALGRLHRLSGGPVRLCAHRAQASQLEPYRDALSSAGVGSVDVILPASLAEFIKVVATARAVLAGESAGAHIAAALDKRLCLVMGGGAYGLCLPWRRSARQVVVNERLPCYGCGWFCTETAIHCLGKLRDDAVAAGLAEALAT